MKTCFKCKNTYTLAGFHENKAMKDGHLNKCKYCVLSDVSKWRKKNPSCRKQEYSRVREKQGHIPREEWLNKIKKEAKGRQICSIEYSHRRRNKIKMSQQTELDLFVIEEALLLAKLREKVTGIKWHLDHIVPINHKNACGLHNAFNVQVVPASWNVKKRNLNMDSFINLSGY